jgi:hypothetical protein
LADGSVGDGLAHLLDDACRLVTEDKLLRNLIALPVMAIGAADARRNDLDKDVVVPDRLDRTLLDLDLSRRHPDTGSIGGGHVASGSGRSKMFEEVKEIRSAISFLQIGDEGNACC